MSTSDKFKLLSQSWVEEASRVKYFERLSWLGRPIIQVPQDTYSFQKIVWETRPDLIVETGIAYGGSLVLSASMLALLDYCDAVSNYTVIEPRRTSRKVIGIDVDIRPHNRVALEAHPLSHFFHLIEGSSVAENVIREVERIAASYVKVLVCLDSNHTHEHVLDELKAYAPLVTRGSYCIVWDTGIEDLPVGSTSDRPWGKGNNPKTAVWEFLKLLDCDMFNGIDGSRLKFEIDHEIEDKIVLTGSPDGFLRRI